MDITDKTIREICKFISSKLGEDIKALRVGEKTILADWFIICSAKNENHVNALAQEIDDFSSSLGMTLRRSDGIEGGRWVVLDYTDVLIHIFHPDEREFYNLERLWESGDNLLNLDMSDE